MVPGLGDEVKCGYCDPQWNQTFVHAVSTHNNVCTVHIHINNTRMYIHVTAAVLFSSLNRVYTHASFLTIHIINTRIYVNMYVHVTADALFPAETEYINMPVL